MRRDGENILLSASDLMRFQGCGHATALDRRYLLGEDLQPVDDTTSAVLVQKKGDAHEAAYLERIQKNAEPVTVIATEKLSLAEAAGQTRQALSQGAAHIYQAAFKSGAWGGYADFLERVERPSKLGAFSYEVVDTKLKRSPDPKHLLQLGLYADLLKEIQGVAPERVHIELGNSERASFRLTDYASYARRLRRRLEAFVADPQPTRSEPVAGCGMCRWRERCEQEWESADSLCLVAGISRSQRRKLETAGILTIRQLAECDTRVPKLAAGTLARLKVQAELQHGRRQGGAPSFRVRDAEAGRGLARLPKPHPGDLFFDMEGDPFVEGGLEYLFGIYQETGGTPSFTDIWAHDREQEGQSTAKVLALFEDHLRKHPDAHIYHYAQYEVTALKRLASHHGVGEMALDRLLRAQKFVDLYRVVQQGVIASESGYSLTDLEVFYMPARDGDVATAGDSIVAYEAFRETADAGTLEQIRAYNETDCRSTKGLRDWLIRDVRPKDAPWWGAVTRETTAPTEATEDPYEIEREKLRARLDRAKGSFGEKPTELLFELASFHRREDKPAWWAMFDRAEQETEELIDDLDSLGGLQAMGPATQVKRSLVRRYRFPTQETKLREGSKARARIEGLKSVTVEALDLDDLSVDVKFGPSAGPPPETLDLIPDGPIDNEALRMAIQRVVADVAHQKHRYGAIEQLLQRQPPRGKGLKVGQPILVEGGDLISGVTKVIAGLQTSCLPIQGPPGTGKTYVSSQADRQPAARRGRSCP